MEQKTISDLIGYLLSIKYQYGNLELYKLFNEPILDLGDLVSVNEECETLEFNYV